MQKKVFLYLALTCCSSIAVMAQRQVNKMAVTHEETPAVQHVYKPVKKETIPVKDSVISNKVGTKEADKTAVVKQAAPVTKPAPNTGSVIKPEPVAAAGKYKPVPLAGEKAYYGTMNDYIVGFVKQYFSTNNKTITIVQDRGSNKKFETIDKILSSHEIPTQLKYLAVIESALNNNAVSRVGAVGPWQFMEATGRFMGLSITGKRDDRTDLSKSTVAAAKYLSYLYSQLNDWLLVVAAYNSGPEPVKRAISRTGSTNFWDIKKYLPRETQGHVLAFIATATIFEKFSTFIGKGVSLPHLFDNDKDTETAKAEDAKPAKPVIKFTREELESMAIVRLTQPLSIELVCHELNIDKGLLNKWNPDYELFLLNLYPENKYDLRMPKEKLSDFIAKKEVLQKKSKQILDEQFF